MDIYNPPEMFAVADRVVRRTNIGQYGFHKSTMFFSFLGCLDESVFPDEVVLSEGYEAELISPLEVSMII